MQDKAAKKLCLPWNIAQLYQFWIVLLLTPKVATEKESGILWLSDNQIIGSTCSLTIRKFVF